jgi:regulatory associated protein of mTOR
MYVTVNFSANGEIWVFNRSYTQYIPLSLYDLQSWMGSPSIFVYDCSNAGIIVTCFEQFAEQHEREYLEQVRIYVIVKYQLLNS